jgi:hypothetical protein
VRFLDGVLGTLPGMKNITRTAIAGLALAALIAPISKAVPVSAQAYGNQDVPTYTTWQTDWDANRYDRQHVMIGEVAGFTPYRLVVSRPSGAEQTIDLKNGTMIYPTGATPTQGERVALVGYYSQGTFIANRVILRP